MAKGDRGHTEFPATSNPSGLVPGSPLGGSILETAEPGPIPNTKMETSSPAKFMFWPEAGSLPEPGLGLHPRTECFPLGMMASRKGQAGSGGSGGGGWVDRTMTFCQVPKTDPCCVTWSLLRDFSEPQVSQPPVDYPAGWWQDRLWLVLLGDAGTDRYRRRMNSSARWVGSPNSGCHHLCQGPASWLRWIKERNYISVCASLSLSFPMSRL